MSRGPNALPNDVKGWFTAAGVKNNDGNAIVRVKELKDLSQLLAQKALHEVDPVILGRAVASTLEDVMGVATPGPATLRGEDAWLALAIATKFKGTSPEQTVAALAENVSLFSAIRDASPDPNGSRPPAGPTGNTVGNSTAVAHAAPTANTPAAAAGAVPAGQIYDIVREVSQALALQQTGAAHDEGSYTIQALRTVSKDLAAVAIVTDSSDEEACARSITRRERASKRRPKARRFLLAHSAVEMSPTEFVAELHRERLEVLVGGATLHPNEAAHLKQVTDDVAGLHKTAYGLTPEGTPASFRRRILAHLQRSVEVWFATLWGATLTSLVERQQYHAAFATELASQRATERRKVDFVLDLDDASQAALKSARSSRGTSQRNDRPDRGASRGGGRGSGGASRPSQGNNAPSRDRDGESHSGQQQQVRSAPGNSQPAPTRGTH